ncbi:hypothetical protein PHYSODRAFT_285090 [Phytophthora sojae]|uniref:RxLR effector protein n=1 Tax=Phytophthora sojae (strain P6497) TaxID=1094619 RepID=G4YVH2_PHYSP|nr:hypothetical protein PHYSODRAFT_285090 [Phytophthora sojae]EGZ25535.1 hypothetical protein PHYSODRAFT_285090 [Phytophthora sojae]|eukprot:XP_009520823.1 hypothetical protein PHYSODRAFT_285090 [Phytophthora sojae]
MRFSTFLLVVAFTLAACCQGFTNADDASRKNLVVDGHAPALRKLENTAAIDPAGEAREVPGIAKLKALMAEVPFLNKIKAMVGKGADIKAVKAAAEKSPEVKNIKAATGGAPIKLDAKDAAKVVKEVKKQRHPSISVTLSVLKMLAVVGAISLTVGFLVYIKENWF